MIVNLNLIVLNSSLQPIIYGVVVTGIKALAFGFGFKVCFWFVEEAVSAVSDFCNQKES